MKVMPIDLEKEKESVMTDSMGWTFMNGHTSFDDFMAVRKNPVDPSPLAAGVFVRIQGRVLKTGQFFFGEVPKTKTIMTKEMDSSNEAWKYAIFILHLQFLGDFYTLIKGAA